MSPIKRARAPHITQRRRWSPSKQRANTLPTDLAQHVINTMGQGLMITNARWEIAYINPALAKMLDISTTDWLGKPVIQIFDPADHPIVQDALAQRRQGKGSTYEAHLRKNDGSLIPVLVNGVPRFRGKQIIGTIVVITDLTERKQIEDQLRTSMEYARSIIDSSLDMIITVDNERRIVEFNRAAEQTFGYKREEVIGKHINLLYANQAQSQTVHRSATTGETFTGEVANRRKNGEIFYSLISTAVMRNARGERIGIVGVSRDITERRKMEQQLRESEERYRLVINNLGEGIAFADVNENFTFTNPAMEHIFGVPPGGLVGRTLRDFTTPDQFAIVRAQTQQRAAGEKSVYELEITRPDGEKRYLVVTAAPWFGRGGEFLGAFGLFRDITLRKRAEQAEREQRILAEALRDTAVVLNSTLEIDQVLDRILTNVGRVVPHDAANIMLLTDDHLQIVGWRGYDSFGMAESISSVRFKIDDVRTFREMRATGQPIVVPDTRADPTWIDSSISQWVRSYAGAPIRMHNQTIGFVNLDSTTPGFYKYEHAERLRAFADQAAVAISNAQMYQEIQQIAITDPLTGLYNRRGLLSFGNREVERALRYNRPLSAIFFDIDHFKQVNDTYGHSFGDKVLQMVAHVCLHHLRSVDIIGRYGGEEFLVLLPETTAPVACQIAERLRMAVADTPVWLNDEISTSEYVHITISLGVAAISSGVPELAMLIELADQAQYRAKQAGRNRVEMCE
jgi:diguanylate cyclase (GGDEF)-like protein/PAS domain S-box-containing protein